PGEEFHTGLEPEIEDRKLACRARDRGDVLPSTRNFPEYHEEAQDGAEDVKAHLYHVGPDHGRHTAFKSVKKGEYGNEYDRGDFPGPEDNRDDQRYGEHPYPFGKRARH